MEPKQKGSKRYRRFIENLRVVKNNRLGVSYKVRTDYNLQHENLLQPKPPYVFYKTYFDLTINRRRSKNQIGRWNRLISREVNEHRNNKHYHPHVLLGATNTNGWVGNRKLGRFKPDTRIVKMLKHLTYKYPTDLSNGYNEFVIYKRQPSKKLNKKRRKEKVILLSENVIKSSLPLEPYNDVTMHIVNSDPSIGEITLGFNEHTAS